MPRPLTDPRGEGKGREWKKTAFSRERHGNARFADVEKSAKKSVFVRGFFSAGRRGENFVLLHGAFRV